MSRRRTSAVNFVQRDLKLRKQLADIYNKTLEDFPNLRDYNDYLEEVETIIYNLTYEIEVPSQQAKIERYRRENRQSMYAKHSKQAATQSASQRVDAAASAFVVSHLPNPIAPKQRQFFEKLVASGYRRDELHTRRPSDDEIMAGGFGNFKAKRQKLEAYAV
eukprot:NODE_2885_length_729_cov_260.645588_g2037_i0.p1 GENE.NODE_2885_length_729_cov_260.645588_g2037_i0~~NODE_2885_length_729_cov_260.645588_g2037_i0.p1  ORF type:complete len:162 (+),score=68.49 NODE_2885_length_729_cov_260.645588_g2037_i0:190-675(+)